MSTAVSETRSDQSTALRYESLIRLRSASVRAQREPQELFGILVHELGQVLQFGRNCAIRRAVQ